MDKEIFKDKKLLTRFIWKLQFLPDTPALIQFVAGDEDYLSLCSRIVNAADDSSRDLQILKDICRQQDLNYQVLKDKLTPVARAFGLVQDERDYYELLGVARDASATDVKKAFRKNVIKVHPDTSDQISANSAEFINLQAAYQILSDPVLRQQYDENLHDVNLWKEKVHQNNTIHGLNPLIAQKANQGPPARTKFFYQLGGLFLLLIIAVLIFDFLFQQNAIFDDGGHLNQPKQAVKSKPLMEEMKPDRDDNSVQPTPEVKFGPNRSDDARPMFKPDDPSQAANHKKTNVAPVVISE